VAERQAQVVKLENALLAAVPAGNDFVTRALGT